MYPTAWEIKDFHEIDDCDFGPVLNNFVSDWVMMITSQVTERVLRPLAS